MISSSEGNMTIALPSIRQPQRRRKILRRLRLLDGMHQNASRKLTFICAPAGFGKTTLLIDYANDTDFMVCWYQIKYSDNNLSLFFQHLLSSIREKQSNFGVSIEKILFQGSNLSPRTLATEMVNELSQGIQDYTLLILDDYHLVCEDMEIVTFIEALLENLPEHVRIIIGSRSVYGIPTASLYVNEELAIIAADDLRFRANEVKDLARQHFQLRITDQQAEEIILKADGWIIAILLAFRDGTPSIAIPKLADARERVYDYFGKEVYFYLPDEIKFFLQITAICDEFTSEMANYIIKGTSSEKTIQYLEDQNLFISSSQSKNGIYYQYHALFKDFLESCFQDLPAEQQEEIHRRFSKWYEAHDEIQNAIHHLQKAGDREYVARIMDNQANAMYISGQEAILETWYKTLLHPGDIRQLAPELLLNLVKARISQGKMEDCLELLLLAEPIFRERNDNDNLANLLVMRGLAYTFKGDYKDSIFYADEANKVVTDLQLDRHYAFQAIRVKGLATYHQGCVDQALILLDEALNGFKDLLATSPSDRLKHEIIMILADIGFIALGQGDVYRAQRSFGEAYELSLNMRGNQGDLATSANNYAYLSFLLGDLQAAWKYNEQSLQAADQVGWDRIIVSILNSQAEVLMQVDELTRAESALQRACQILEKKPSGRNSSYTFHLLAELESLKGNFNQAMFHLREAAAVSSADFNDAEYQIRLAEIYLAMEQPDLVITTLGKIIHKIEEHDHPSQSRSKAYCLMALAKFATNNIQEAQQFLSKALISAAQLGYDYFLVNLNRRNPDMVFTLYKEWENKQLATIIKRLKNFQTGYQHLVTKIEEIREAPTPTLQIRAFGDGEIRRNSEVIPNAIWQSAGARALFYFILDRGKVKRDEIVVQFWPDFSNAKVNSNFHATLWRVRNALGSKQIIAFDGVNYSINQATIFYDVLEFEELLEKLKNPNLPEMEQRELELQVVEIYQGDFLGDIDMPWFDTRRGELKEKFRNHIEKVAERALDRRSFNDAKKYYEKAIELDPYQDYFHLGLLKSLIGMRSPAAAKAHYINYVRLLRDEVGVAPILELSKLFENI
jgi:ATP/maltotriose-dependent transcriptional regulator MalT/DNA-binding SARP family transcriptional activator